MAVSLIGLLFLPATPSLAHAQITSTAPSQNSVVSEVPTQVMVEFDGNLTQIDDLTINVLKVFNESGVQIDDGKTIVGGARLTVGISDRTGSGTFRVTYRVVSEDGHPITNEYTFRVTPSSKSASPNPEVSEFAIPNNSEQAEDSSSDKDEVAPLATGVSPISHSDSEHENFIFNHRTHIFQFTAVALLILAWWLIERRRRN